MTPATRRSVRLRNAALWILQVAAAAMLAMTGVLKLTGAPEMIAVFDAIGLGQWFRYLTGALEVVGAALLLVPALAGIGALLLVGVLTGAVLTHLLLIGGSAKPALTWLTVVAVVAYGRRGRTIRLIGR